MKRLVPYLFVAIWTGLATIAQAVMVETLGLGVWAPDVPIFLLVAALAQLYKSDAVRVSLVAALARATFTVEPPFAIVAGSLAVGLAADVLRRLAELSQVLTRAALVGTAAFFFGLWLVFVDAVRTASPVTSLVNASTQLLPTALTSALLALFAWPLARKLPGLRSIERRAF
ncbi:MAG: hypothetical protein R3F49_17130 [Planctomycetota bacterium]